MTQHRSPSHEINCTLKGKGNKEIMQIIDVAQGSKEWLDLRKTKITATDSVVIMNSSPWKTKVQLYHEKTSDNAPNFVSQRMQRGTDLEPVARQLFSILTGIYVKPEVLVKEWAMASLDGIDPTGKKVVEIKCPGPKDHAIALSKKVPDHYYPQLQHQMYVSGVDGMYYFSFDGQDGVIVEIERDDIYIEKMIAEELKFFKHLTCKIPPPHDENDCIERDDIMWLNLASTWLHTSKKIKDLEIEENEIRKELIRLSNDSNCRGGGISMSQVERRGNVDYSMVPQLKGIDLDQYRKGSSTSWRIRTT